VGDGRAANDNWRARRTRHDEHQSCEKAQPSPDYSALLPEPGARDTPTHVSSYVPLGQRGRTPFSNSLRN
jgi:hypothetical protein